MLVLWLYHYRFSVSLKLQITEILLTFMKFFFRLLWILPARKRSFTKMSFVLRIVLVCKITTTALIKKINIQTKQTEHLNKQLENFQFKVRLSLRRKSQRKRKRKRKFSHAFSHALALAFALLPMSICLHYLLRLRPRFFFHVCLIEVCLSLNLRWVVSGVSKRECFVYLIFIMCLRQHMYVVCSTLRSRFLNNIWEWPKNLTYPFISSLFCFLF